MDLHKYLLSADGEDELMNAPLETHEKMLQERFMELKEKKKLKRTKKSEISIESSSAMTSIAITKGKGSQKRSSDTPAELNSMLQEKKKKICTKSSASASTAAVVRSSATCTSRVSDDSTCGDSTILDGLDRLFQDEVDSKFSHVARDPKSNRDKKFDPSDNDLLDISQIWPKVSSSMESESDDILQINVCPLLLDGSEAEEGLDYWHSIDEENNITSPTDHHTCTKKIKRTRIESDGQGGSKSFLGNVDKQPSSPVSVRSRTSEAAPTSPATSTSPITPTSPTTPTSPLPASVHNQVETKRR